MKRVLLIEDNVVNAELLRRRLERRGYLVSEATSAERGIERARADAPDLILLDLHLPGLDGLSALKVLKGEPGTFLIPVIVITADTLPETRAAAFAGGCLAFAGKPFDIDRLLDIVATALGTVGTPGPALGDVRP